MSVKPLSVRQFALLTLLSVMLSACGKECCDCSGSSMYKGTYCEDDLPSGFTSWQGYKAALKEGGCSCN